MRRISSITKTFSALFILSSIGCQKEINKNKDNIQDGNPVTTTTGSCKPVGFALFQTAAEPNWMNLMLRWYGTNGKIINLKAVVMENFNVPNPEFSLDYGEVIYLNNDVHVRDVSSNKIILSVKLDNAGHPQNSWFDGSFHGGPWQDITTYYYSGDRLDSLMISYRSSTAASDPFTTIMYRAEYDGNGNILHLTGPPTRVNFKYDYTKFNPGLMPNYVISIPTKLLEYLDLFHLPHNNMLNDVVYGAYPSPIPSYPDNTFPVYGWTTLSPTTNSTGQIGFYQDNNHSANYYTAWDCNNSQIMQSKNPTREEFMSLVH